MTSSFVARHDLVAHVRELVRDLRNENDVRRAGEPCVQRDESGVPAHDFDDEHPVVAFGGRVQTVDRFERGVHGRVEAEGRDGTGDVVVDRFGHADDAHPLVEKPVGDGKRPVTTDHDDRVDPELTRGSYQLVRPIGFLEGAIRRGARPLERIPAVRRSQDRAATGQNSTDLLER